MSKFEEIIVRYRLFFFGISVCLGFILAMTILYRYEKHEMMTRVDQQLESIIRPTVENTTFSIDGEVFVLNFISSSLENTKAYMTSSNQEAIVKIGLYKDEVSKDNLLGQITYRPNVRRDSLRTSFYLYNTCKENNYKALIDEVCNAYYNYRTNRYALWPKTVHKSGKYVFDYVDFDNRTGCLIKPGIVTIEKGYTGNLGSMRLSTTFMMVTDGQQLEIIIDVKEENRDIREWNDYKEDDLLSYMLEESLEYSFLSSLFLV